MLRRSSKSLPILVIFIIIICNKSFNVNSSEATEKPAGTGKLSGSAGVVDKDDDKPILDDLSDIEILTYFLLYNNYNNQILNAKLDEKLSTLTSAGFLTPAGSSSSSSSSSIPNILNDSINEMKLRQFITDLKNNRLNIYERPHDERFVCDKFEHEIDKFYTSSLPGKPNRAAKCAKYERLWNLSINCQSSQDLYNLLANRRKKNEVNNNPINTSETITFNKAIVRLCPLLLFQLHNKSCRAEREQIVNERLRPSAGAVWGFAILFVTIISFCSLVGVAIMPLLNKNSYLNVLNLFEGLAVGSLVGSAIFHLIPQAFDLVGQVSTQDYLWKALLIFTGIYLFFLSERFMKIMVDIRKKRKMKEVDNFTSITDNCEPKLLDVIGKQSPKSVKLNEMNPGKDQPNSGNSKMKTTETDTSLMNGGEMHCCNAALKTNENTIVGQTIDPSLIDSINQQHNHTHMVMQGDSPIATLAWMIIFGDGFHNFIDGLSIGAAFSDSILSGISISVAVICEEFPHELGDFAVLIASGMTTRQAVGYNFLSACTCYLGMAFGILVGDFTQGGTYIFAFAGGMFLYIALVDMMAELTAGLDEALKESKTQMFKILLLQNLGMLLGVCILFLLAKYSEHINFEGLAPPTSLFS